MSKRDERQIGQFAEVIGQLLTSAVDSTIQQRSPDPARDCAAYLLEVDEEVTAEGGTGPGEVLGTITLLLWSGRIRRQLSTGSDADPAARIDESLAWIEGTLGRRYRARARYVSGALRSEQEADEVMLYAEALADDFLPALVWLIAGVVAAHAGGDVEWLRKLNQGTSLAG